MKFSAVFIVLFLALFAMVEENSVYAQEGGLGNDGWGCSRGFYKSDDQCVKLVIPSNGKLNYLGTSWVCKNGFYKSGNKCLEVVVPENAKLNYKGDGWNCKQGFTKLVNICVTIKMPANAELNESGGWRCISGYEKKGKSCIAIPLSEIRAKERREEFLKSNTSKPKPYEFSCEEEYKTSSEVCVLITESTLKCKKSFGAGFYRNCTVDVRYDYETDYKGGGSLDFDVICTAEVEYNGRQIILKQTASQTKDHSHNLDALGNDSGELSFKMSFSSSKEVSSAKISSIECSVDNIDLY